MKGFKLITIFLGVMLWVLGFHVAAFAKTTSTKINRSKAGKDTRYVKQNPGGAFDGNGKRTTTVQGGAGTKPSQASQPKSVYKPPAALSMKSVDHIKAPQQSPSRSSSSSSSSRSSGSKPYSSLSKK